LQKKFIGEILLELGHISQADLDKALAEQKELVDNEQISLLGEILIQQKYITRAQFNEALIISLEEILNDENSKEFIKDITSHAIKNIKSITVSLENGKLSDEGTFVLKTRLSELEGRHLLMKKKLISESQAKQTEFRIITIQNMKSQLIELETRITAIKSDIENFCD